MVNVNPNPKSSVSDRDRVEDNKFKTESMNKRLDEGLWEQRIFQSFIVNN